MLDRGHNYFIAINIFPCPPVAMRAEEENKSHNPELQLMVSQSWLREHFSFLPDD